MSTNETSQSHVHIPHVHIPKVGTLVAVWATLIVCTFITAEIATINLGEWNIVVAMLIACFKATLVAWIFMGVRHTPKLTKLFCVGGLVFLSILLLITFSDYSSRSWTYHASPWATNKALGTSK